MNRLRHALHPSDRPADAGLSLAELLVYMVLSGIVLAIVGTLLVTTLVTQRDVRAQATASSAAQVVLTDMENALRNAVSVRTPSSFDGNLLVVKTRIADSDADSSFTCRGWYLDPATGRILTVRGAPGSTAPTRGLTTGSDFSRWAVALEDVRRSTVTASPAPVFTAEGATGAHIRFEVLDGEDGSSLTITSAAIPRAQGTSTGSTSCF
ncbi:hypothetical protein [Cellulomonas sp. NPDC089187]|uniref:PilW family protein n=1 Tax=Cellulomonas sp. NPDC089187 TaxID=3154970 RepID=UPI003436F6ED